MNKHVVNNRVAVLTNPTHGWFTVHHDLARVFDPELVQKVLSGAPDVPPGLMVEWLVPGDRFVIEIWQGQETVRVFVPDIYIPYQRPDNWLVA
jgi:hypothetical protein